MNKGTKRLRRFALVGLALLVLTCFAVWLSSRQAIAREKRLRVMVTFSSFGQIRRALEEYEQDYGTWPASFEALFSKVPEEALSSRHGNNSVHSSYDGSGGWVYDAGSRTFKINVDGTVGEILAPYRGPWAETRPSELK